MKKILLGGSVIAAFFLTNCNKPSDNPPVPSYPVPETYNFEHVNYSGQSQRLSQLYELRSYMATSRTIGAALDYNRLIGMYVNDSVAAQWQKSYDASKQIKDKTQLSQQELFTKLFNNLSQSSTSTSAGSPGTAGVVESLDGSSAYLLNADGVDEGQIIEKGLMGAFIYYQIAAVYLGEDKMNVDNTTVEPGNGTAMEHHWDEAFGYFGVPLDFPSTTTGTQFWGSYSNSRDAAIGSNKVIMDAYLKGRAAISNNIMTDRNEAITVIRREFARVAAASAIHYINSAVALEHDTARRCHYLSEAAGFIYGLQFNPDKRQTNQEITDLLVKIGGSSDISGLNFYSIYTADLLVARDRLAQWYGMEALKESL